MEALVQGTEVMPIGYMTQNYTQEAAQTLKIRSSLDQKSSPTAQKTLKRYFDLFTT